MRAGFSGFDFFSNNLGLHQRFRAGQRHGAAGFPRSPQRHRPDQRRRRRSSRSADTGVVSPRYNVNLPVANPAGSIAYMLLGQDFLIDLELSAAQAEGRGEVISTPRVITANQREASIEQGVEIPYQESASSGATTISFKKAVLALKVTPQVTPDNRIILDLNVKKDSVGQVIVGGAGSAGAFDRHPRDHHAGARERRSDRRARRHPRDRASRDREEGARTWATCRCSAASSRPPAGPTTRTSC